MQSWGTKYEKKNSSYTDEKGNLLHRVDLRGYEFTAEYNAYVDPLVEHDVCADMLRNAGTFDDWIYYEYVY